MIYTILGLFLQNAQAQIKPQQFVASTPPMGWNSWNFFGSSVNEEVIKKTADLLVEKGLANAGYKYLVIDDTWVYGRVKRSFDKNAPEDRTGRDASGRIIVDSSKFPSGMKSLADYVHSKGLKFGIYTAPGCSTCGGFTGSFGYEATDVKTYSEWGVDFIKLDQCGAKESPEVILKRWRSIIDSIGRPIVLSVNLSNQFNVTSKYADMWRTTLDMMPVWRYKNDMLRAGGDDIYSVMKQQEGLGKYQVNGRWNDSELLQVGNGKIIKTDNKGFDYLGEQTRLIKGNMTYDENKAHFGMWAINSVPLILTNDLSTMSDSLLNLVVNPEVIAINQDPAGVLAVKCKEDIPGVQVWVKQLWQVGNESVAFLNATDNEQEVSIKLSEIGISGQAFFRDLFLRKDLGLFSDKFSVRLQKNSILLAKVTAFETIKPIKSLVKTLDFNKGPVRLEAEDTRFYAGRSQNKLAEFSGKGYAIGENHAFSKFSFFWDVNLESSGNYKVVVRYINSGNSELIYKINDMPIVFKCTPSKKDKWSETSITLPLNKGRQEIGLIAPNCSSNELAVDYIECSKAVK
ncbi:MAG: alpha-galactosidase [Paludibacter sp.]